MFLTTDAWKASLSERIFNQIFLEASQAIKPWSIQGAVDAIFFTLIFHLRWQIPERCLLKVKELLGKWCRSNQTLFIQTPFNMENWISMVYSRVYLFHGIMKKTDTARNKWVDYAVMKCLAAVHSSICHVQWWGFLPFPSKFVPIHYDINNLHFWFLMATDIKWVFEALYR